MAPKELQLTAAQRRTVARLRLAAQGLLPGIPPGTSNAPATTPGHVLEALGMMQAQDLSQGCWAVGVRLKGSGLSDIHAALANGSIIRCWGARGTLMLVSPQLHGTLLSVTAPRMNATMATTRAQENITEDEIGTLAQVARERCAGAGATRAQLLASFAASGSSIAGQRGYHLIVAVSLRGVIVQDPMEPGSATRQLFLDAAEWIPDAGQPTDAAAALVLLVQRYFESHGPATIADCAWWLGVPLTPVRAAVRELGQGLGSTELGGVTYHYAPAHAERWAKPPGARSVLALPGFDEFLLGYRDRSATLPAEHAQAVTPGKNGIFLRTVVASGQTIGTWRPVGTGTGKGTSGSSTSATGAAHPAGFVPFEPGLGPVRARQITARLQSQLEFGKH